MREQSLVANLVSYMEYHQDIVNSLFDKDITMDKSNETTISGKSKDKFEKSNISEEKLHKNHTKNIVACVWLCEKFPLTIEHLLPILDILSNVSANVLKLKSFFEGRSLAYLNSFPIKAVIPLFLSLNAIIEFKNFDFKYIYLFE